MKLIAGGGGAQESPRQELTVVFVHLQSEESDACLTELFSITTSAPEVQNGETVDVPQKISQWSF